VNLRKCSPVVKWNRTKSLLLLSESLAERQGAVSSPRRFGTADAACRLAEAANQLKSLKSAIGKSNQVSTR
jgi:hypothetical protein